jgi:hypothetical protein
MGNQSSNDKKERTLLQATDYIATNLILTQNFKDMKNLADMNYCDNLVILTSDAIDKNLDHLDVYFLSQRLKSGQEINEMKSDRISYLKKDKIAELDIKNKTNKRRMCIGIAKFYVKLAHLFAAIVTTINPSYTYKNSIGETKKINLLEKSALPSGVNANIESVNLCGNRISALINRHDYNVDNKSEVIVKPDLCNINYDRMKGSDKNLGNEPGIPELQQLYYDKYDYDQGGFGGKMNIEDNMTPEMYARYNKDLLSFYKAFTGNSQIPMVDSVDIKGNTIKVPGVKKFGDIPLRSYHKSEGCKPNGLFTKEYRGTFKDKLFYEYAQHIKKMLSKTENTHAELLKIIDKLFIFVNNSQTEKKEIVISPSLNEKKLQEIVEDARKIIVNLYLTCEEDFVKGLDIFEAIVETQIKETSLSQISQLEKALDETLSNPSANENVIQEIKQDVIKPVVFAQPQPNVPVVAQPNVPRVVVARPNVPVVAQPVVF